MLHQSYALTLYTLWHLQQLERHATFYRSIEQHDLASLVAYAFNAPKELPDVKDRYLNLFLPRLGADTREARIRRALVHVEAHQHMVLVASSEDGG